MKKPRALPGYKQAWDHWKENVEGLEKELRDCREGCQRLKLEKDMAQKGWQTARLAYEQRPTVEKIVEKEVLPWYVKVILLFIMALSFGETCVAVFGTGPYKIVEPYMVQIVKHDGIPMDRWNDCQQSYKDDQRELRHLRYVLKETYHERTGG